MRKSNVTSVITILFLVFVLHIMLAIMLFVMGFSALSIDGFGIDSTGQVYIGRLHKIEIYQNGIQVSQIDVPRYRTWCFEISKEDTILLTNGNTIYELSLSGESLSKTEDKNGEYYARLIKQRARTGNDGREYRLKSPFGWTRIINADGNSVYKIPAIDYFTQMSFLSVIGLLITIPLKKRKTGDGSLSGTGDGSVVPSESE